MTISLHHIVPVPLKERIEQRQSDIWGQSLHWKKGEWIQIVAPSGTGKTTLVHVLWCLRHDYEGRLQYNGQDTQSISPGELASFRQTQLSVVFQDLRLFPKLTGWDNIELKRQMSAKPYCSKEEAAMLAEEMGVAKVMHRPASTCSYGEQQRIALVRALVQPFDWLIMDEPFSHLDQQNRKHASRLIEEACAARGAGFVLTDLDGNTTLSCHKTLFL